MLEPQEVLSGRSGRGDGESPLHRALIPGDSRGGDGSWALLPDLEEVSVAVPAGDIGGRTGKVRNVWAGVDDLLVDGETDRGASRDGGDVGSGLGIDVAAEVVGAQVLNGRVGVLGSPFADVLEVGLDLAVEDEAVETV